MNSATAIRRVAASASSRRAAARVCPATRRSIATQEKDPQLGDYPQLPDRSRALLPPTGWWDNQMRRNFGEIVCFSSHEAMHCSSTYHYLSSGP